LGQVDACQQRLEKMPTLLKRFRQSILAAACSGRLTADWREENPNVKPASEILSQISKEREKVKLRKAKKISDGDEIEFPFDIPKTWTLCFFDDLAAVKPNAIKAGPFGSSLTKACYVPKGFKVYGQEQVINGDPNFGDYYINEEKFKELQSCEVSAGDILVSLVGTIGKVLVIPEKFQPGIINPRLAKFSLHPTIVREYIANYLLSTLAKNMMSQQSHGGTMEILNLGIMRKLPIPLAPLAEQQEIVRRVAGLFALADQLELRLAQARGQVAKLTPSLLARAFAGKLVPQNPKDEPASALLERIKVRS
jgi:type I restriction enzyme S subunit